LTREHWSFCINREPYLATSAFFGIYPEFRQLGLWLLLPKQALLDLMLGDLALNNRGQR
jgi:hypothetical protein